MGINGTLLNIFKAIHHRPVETLYSIGKINSFNLRSGTIKGRPLTLLLFNIVHALNNVSGKIKKLNKELNYFFVF